MRLTTLIILVTMFQLSAARSFGQQFSYVGKNIPLIKFFKEIKKQTGYNTVWSGEDLDLSESVNANFHNAELEEVLKISLSDLPITYTIRDNTINLKSKGPALDEMLPDFAAIDIRGRVVGEKNQPLFGATVKVKGTNTMTITDSKGEFVLKNIEKKAKLIISYVGYETETIAVLEKDDLGTIKLTSYVSKLEEVEVVSTGYQYLPKERATGSFVLINNDLINRSVSTNILDRLKGVTSGLLFDNTTKTDVGFSIRGRSTIFANTNPLIVLDNFPYDGDLSTINPNDVENISILKDAAAASIWGVRAGNGVVVIRTKKGRFDKQLKVGFNSNVTIGEKPDLFSKPDLNASDYIELERFLFSKGKFSLDLATPEAYISPVVEILSTQTNQNEIDRQLNQLKQQDIKNDLLKYYYRNALNQQYALTFDGGGRNNQYYFSAGYDHNNQDYVSDSNERLNLTARNTYSFLKDKLQANIGIRYTSLKRISNSGNASIDHYMKPYTDIVNERGEALSVLMHKQAWLDTVGSKKLLDWKWTPKDELDRRDHRNTLDNYLLNLDLNYKIIEGLDIQGQYQYAKGSNELNHLSRSDSYYTRNLINQYSIVKPNEVIRPVPLGDILEKALTHGISQSLRLQVNYSKSWPGHTISALAGSDIKDYNNRTHGYTLYGYDENNGLVSNVDFSNTYKNIVDGSLKSIPGKSYESGQTDRYISYFSNAQWAYHDNLIFSASVRFDESNLFGVKTNQKGVPLWSAGGIWNITQDVFQSVKWIDQLRARLTFGCNGNVDKTVSAFVTAQSIGNNRFTQQTAMVINPPNASLRWEKIKMLNLALEYSLFNNRLSGNIEYYQKRGKDIIGNSPLAPSTGIVLFKGNSANISGNGFDITISSQNIVRSNFGWRTELLISKTQDKITAYNVNTLPLDFHVNYPYSGIFSYRWAGLHSETGDPMGFSGGLPSRNYGIITNADSLNNTTEYSGPGTPTHFGSIRNSFTYKNFSLSFNIIYKLGYYFRSSSVRYVNLFTLSGTHQDYTKRWIEKGDESKTDVPSAIYPTNFQRDDFYTNSSVLVEKGDHIRLQDIRLSYDINKQNSTFKNIGIYLYASNLGLIWKANKKGLDPESQLIPLQKNISIGFKTQF